jgi:diguanylate cyclase (GGDEF)-like protein
MRISQRFGLVSQAMLLVATICIVGAFFLTRTHDALRAWQHNIELAVNQDRSLVANLHFNDTLSINDRLAFLGTVNPQTVSLVLTSAKGRVVGNWGDSAGESSRVLATQGKGLSRQTQYVTLDSGSGSSSGLASAVSLLALPLTSPISDEEVELSDTEYRVRLGSDDGTGARHLVGYLHASASWSQLVADALDDTLWVWVTLALVYASCQLLIYRLLRTISKPIENMARVADAITNDALTDTQNLPVLRNDEIGDIAKVLNSVLDNMRRIKSQLGVDKQLLSLQVDAKAKQLSLAEQQVRESNRQIQRVTYFDPATALPNRKLMFEQLSIMMQIAAREKRHLGLMLIDLTSLRQVARVADQSTADKLLTEIAGRASNAIRKSDIVSHQDKTADVGRLGDDELSIILHGIGKAEDAIATAERISASLSKELNLNGANYRPELFFGLAIAPIHGKEAAALIRAAEIALNHAQERQTAEVLIYEPSMDTAVTERFQIEQDLRRADLDSEFSLHYQPQVDLDTGAVKGMEALLRWQHPTRGNIPPFKFIPIAESSGEIIRLGDWIVKQACQELQRLDDSGLNVPKVSINVAANQLSDRFVALIAQTLTEHNIAPERLQIELTESLMIQNIATAMRHMVQMRNQLGVRLSVDDFGTGYSSLSYLAEFPLNELKVDRKFIIDIVKDEKALRIAAAIIAMAKELELDVVIEGVDDVAQIEKLALFDKLVIQGFLFSKPLPFDALKTYLDNGDFLSPLQQS